jgi:hypothetical protein
VHVAHRVSVAAGRRDAGAQLCVRAMAAATVADAIMSSSTGSTTTARNLAAGRIAAMPRDRDRDRGKKRKRHARPALASTRRSHGCGMSCSVRGSSSSRVSRVKIANLEAMRGSQVLSAFSILLRVRSWRAGKLISLLLSVLPSPGGRDSQGRAGYCVTSGPCQLSLPSQRKTCVM